MIAKHIVSRQGQGFRKLAAYLLVVKGNTDPASWTRAGLLADDAAPSTGKLAWAHVTNCRTTATTFGCRRRASSWRPSTALRAVLTPAMRTRRRSTGRRAT